MKYIRETTDWEYPGHIYAVTDGRMVAYQRKGTTEVTVFPKPLRFSQAKRRFEKVRDTDTLNRFRDALGITEQE